MVVSHSRNSQNRPKILTQILYQKNFIIFSESKCGQNHGQCSEKVEGASVKAAFWHGENMDHAEEKSYK